MRDSEKTGEEEEKQMNRSRGLLGRVMLVWLGLLLSDAPADGAEMKKITFGYSTIGAMAAGSWMAKEIGAFEKYGIDAELIYICLLYTSPSPRD